MIWHDKAFESRHPDYDSFTVIQPCLPAQKLPTQEMARDT